MPTLQSRRIEIHIEPDRCKGCELCVAACPHEVLAMAREINALGYRPVSVVDAAACTGCRACYQVCPEVVFSLFLEMAS